MTDIVISSCLTVISRYLAHGHQHTIDVSHACHTIAPGKFIVFCSRHVCEFEVVNGAGGSSKFSKSSTAMGSEMSAKIRWEFWRVETTVHEAVQGCVRVEKKGKKRVL